MFQLRMLTPCQCGHAITKLAEGEINSFRFQNVPLHAVLGFPFHHNTG